MEPITMLNMNIKDTTLFLGILPNGLSTVQVKLGRKIYVLEVDKNIIDAYITINIGADRYSFACRPDAVLMREVLENAAEIQQAQFIQHKFQAIF